MKRLAPVREIWAKKISSLLVWPAAALLLLVAPWACQEERGEPDFSGDVAQGPTSGSPSGGPGNTSGGQDGAGGVAGGDNMGGSGGVGGAPLGSCDLSGACDQCTACTQFGICVDLYVDCTADAACNDVLECMRSCHLMCPDDTCYGMCRAGCSAMPGFGQALTFLGCFCQQGCQNDCAAAAARDCMQFYQ